MESAEEILLSKLSPFRIEKILSKSLKPKTVKKIKNGTLLKEIYNKNQADEILKWKRFDNIKIKTYSHNSLNTCKEVVKSHEVSLCTFDEIKTNLQDQNVMEIRRIQIKRKTGETIDTNTYIIIIIIISLHQHGYPWPTSTTLLCCLSLLLGFQGYILYWHRAVVCRF